MVNNINEPRTPYQVEVGSDYQKQNEEASDSLLRSFEKHKSDKGSKHQYHRVYGPEFNALRQEPINFLEIGIFEGCSMAAWLDYFPNANVYGIDIFTRVKPESLHEIFDNPRAHWLKANSTQQLAASIMKKEWPDVKFDIILDDGNHTPRCQAQTFMNLNQFLKDDGIYLIEDVIQVDELMKTNAYSNAFHGMKNKWVNKHKDDYTALWFNYLLETIDTPEWNCKRFDNARIWNAVDSCVLKVTKK